MPLYRLAWAKAAALRPKLVITLPTSSKPGRVGAPLTAQARGITGMRGSTSPVGSFFHLSHFALYGVGDLPIPARIVSLGVRGHVASLFRLND